MIFKDSCFMIISFCSLVCFHVTADFNSNYENDNTRDETSIKSKLLAKEETIRSKDKRSAYQQPVLNNPSPALTEDWMGDVNWPAKTNIQLGQVSGVSVNSRGEIVVFHRGDHIWGSHTFDHLNQYNETEKGPITSPTVLVFHPETGALLQQWGENMFYLPHGITIDQEENIWLTDVALHQVFKFPPLSKNERSPLLTLGKAFVPGNSAVRFCKPTSVAITSWGDFFVADGYCNSRLLKFNKAGEKLLEIGHTTFGSGFKMPDPYSFSIPHALTLAEDRKLVCVADRENGRVSCFDWNNGTFVFQISSPKIGPLIYSVAYSPLQGGLFFVVNGLERYSYSSVPVQGYVISASNQRLMSYFGSGLKMPHDIAVSSDGRNVYVVEIGPDVVHKYTHNGSLGPAVITTTSSQPPNDLTPLLPQSLSLTTPQGTVLPAVLVTCAAILFGAAIVTAALVYSRARRRGMSTAEVVFYQETANLVDEEDV